MLKRAHIIALAIGIGLVGPAAAADPPLKIRIGWATMPGHLIPVLYSKREILRHYGTVYTVETVNFRGSTPQITAMAAKELDMAAYAPPSLVLSVTNARLDVRAVADMIQDGEPNHNSDQILVKTASGLDSPAGLKGKRVATNAIGSYMDTSVRAMLLKSGLIDKRDYTIVEAAFPTMPAMIEEDKVDAIGTVQPFSTQMVATGRYKILFRTRDALGRTQAVFLAARGEFLDANRAALMDFFEDHVRALRWFQDPANHAEAIAIIAAFTKQPPAALDYLFSEKDYYRDPFAHVNGPGIQSVIDVSKELGLLPTTIQAEPKYVDQSFTREAERRIRAGK
ncbi:MAG: ABC transporter substrate-binding protein [Proteobacteria bacterium]|nr:ABC transporter substrate-binding protein [Pseudomonadota bacterium]